MHAVPKTPRYYKLYRWSYVVMERRKLPREFELGTRGGPDKGSIRALCTWRRPLPQDLSMDTPQSRETEATIRYRSARLPKWTRRGKSPTPRDSLAAVRKFKVVSLAKLATPLTANSADFQKGPCNWRAGTSKSPRSRMSRQRLREKGEVLYELLAAHGTGSPEKITRCLSGSIASHLWPGEELTVQTRL